MCTMEIRMQEHNFDAMGSVPSPGAMINRTAWPQNSEAATILEPNLVNGHEFPGGPPPGMTGVHHPGFPSSDVIISASSCSSPPPPPGGGGPPGSASAASKKSSSRRNAWGNLSYADLITQAINSTAEKRLTLSQVYEWMVANIPYFKDKGDSNSSAGWKNSIRHNLSLHSRFVRVQNEGTGKSSWWMLNPDAKPGGKTSRRRTASVDNGPNGTRGPDFKRRGRNKKNASNANNAATNGLLRNGASGHMTGHTPGGGAESTPSPNAPVHPAHLANMGPEMYPESPSLHPHQYPFGRMSPSIGPGGVIPHGGEPHPGVGPFGYPGAAGQQEWPAMAYPCEIPYFAANRPYQHCEPTCESDFQNRSMSPQQHQHQLLQQQQQQHQRNGFPYNNRPSFPSPTTPSNNGSEPPSFHPFHTDKLAEANTFPSIQPQQVMSQSPSSVGNGPPSMSPSNHPPPPQQQTGPNNNNNNSSGNNSSNVAANSRDNSRNFSSPETNHGRPSSTNNSVGDPLVSPHPHQQPPPFNFSSQPPQQQQQQPPASMRDSSPSSPGSVKSVNLSNNPSSKLERLLIGQGIKQEFKQEVVGPGGNVAVASSATPAASMTNCIATPMAGGPHNHHSQQQIEEFQHQQQQQFQQQQPQQQQQQQPQQQQLQHHQYPDGILGPDVFPMKAEDDIDSVYLHYNGNVPVGHHHHIGGVAGPQGHHLVGPTRVSGGQEDHLHSPSQYSMATQQQPPWVR